MHIFVTGATGFIGSAVVNELIKSGYTVTGLARSEAAAKRLSDVGARVHFGDLSDLESLRRGAAEADAVIHTAFIHDFTKFKDNCETDRRVIAAMGSALAGSSRPMVVTSGIGILPQGDIVNEETKPDAGKYAHPRSATEEAVNAEMKKGVNISVVRLPPSVHGEGDHGFIPILIGNAYKKRVSAFIGEGLNRWPAVHRLDAARLFRLILENGTAGARYHGVAEEGVVFSEIAGVIGRRLDIPVVSMTQEEAAVHFGWFTGFASMDTPASSLKTRKELGWHPVQVGLIEDIDNPYYFLN